MACRGNSKCQCHNPNHNQEDLDRWLPREHTESIYSQDEEGFDWCNEQHEQEAEVGVLVLVVVRVAGNVVGSSSFVLDGSDYQEDSICIPPSSALARPKEEEDEEAQTAILTHLLQQQKNDTLDEDYQERTSSTTTIDPLLPSRKVDDDDDSCGVYFATSTIAGGKAGNGIFAGKAFAEGDMVTPGDLAVLLTDLEFHHPWQTRTNKILWEEYVYI